MKAKDELLFVKERELLEAKSSIGAAERKAIEAQERAEDQQRTLVASLSEHQVALLEKMQNATTSAQEDALVQELKELRDMQHAVARDSKFVARSTAAGPGGSKDRAVGRISSKDGRQKPRLTAAQQGLVDSMTADQAAAFGDMSDAQIL